MLRLAVVPQSLWDLYMQCFDLFEAGNLKGQTLTSKQLMTKPEVKQTQFQCLLPLNEDIQQKLLGLLVSQDITLKELKKRCEVEKKLSDLRQKFVHLTNSKSWKEAETRFPIHTKQEKLEQFLTLNIKKSTPQSFSLFCAEAVSCKERDTDTDVECTAKISEINKCTFIEVANLDASVITSRTSKYIRNGGSLFIFYMEKVSCYHTCFLVF